MDYITTDAYFTVFSYSVTGNRIKIGTYANKARALYEARKYDNWQIEKTEYLISMPF